LTNVLPVLAPGLLRIQKVPKLTMTGRLEPVLPQEKLQAIPFSRRHTTRVITSTQACLTGIIGDAHTSSRTTDWVILFG